MPDKVIKPISQKKLNIKMHGNQVIQMKHKGNFTRDEIKKYAQRQSNLLSKAGHEGKISISLFIEGGWKSGYFADVGMPVSLYEYLDSDIHQHEVNQFTQFHMYLTKNN